MRAGCARLLVPSDTDGVLDAMGERAAMFDALLHNTASANIVSGGEKINVRPDEFAVELDCRLLPGYGPDELFAELRALAGIEMELEVIRFDEVAADPDLALFDRARGARCASSTRGCGPCR